MEFRILGPVSAERDGHPVPLDGAKQRATLAVLLLAQGRLVTDERLTTLLWGWDPPATSTRQLYTYVSRLRTRLGPGPRLTRHGSGYRMDPGGATLDWHTFRELADTGREHLRAGRFADAERSLAEALALWHGPALGDVTEQLAQAEGPRLEEARLAALEEHAEAALALGRHGDLVPALTGQVRNHPLRERPRGQLMTALYRCGRQADALAVYDEGRRFLAADLGIDPGPALRALHQQILTGTLPHPPAPPRPATTSPAPGQEPPTATTATTAADTLGPAAPAPTAPDPSASPSTALMAHPTTPGPAPLPHPAVQGPAALHPAARNPAAPASHTAALAAAPHAPAAHPVAPPRRSRPRRRRAVVPALLPSAPVDFVGRGAAVEEAIAALRARYDVVVAGAPGTGTSALALRVGEVCRGDFPDGQLYADLRTGDGGRREAREVLGWFLRALGADGHRLPEGVDERAQFFRTLAANRRMLIVLDNAADDAQVRPLLPGGPSRTVVTGTHPTLASLDAVRLVRLGPMTPAEAAGLLASAAGAERLAAEPEATLRVAEFCERLPLALRIAGVRLATRPHWPVARLADRLAPEEHRLDELRIGALDIGTGLRAALEVLTPAVAEALGVLAATGPSRLTAEDAAALLDLVPRHAEDLLEQLADARLLTASQGGDEAGVLRGEPCYRLMPLVRLYALRHCPAASPLPGTDGARVLRPHDRSAAVA
ncbi:AfsR/SARP family transcriptional regulator [Streptomyces sp. NRRL B-2790]|uniref:AfsR/SARP family transcriptional regulator n=1 Tax=Streptomyces sp. NRRL B-2790 TaxID=1463835 RepID=UPI003569E1B2